MSGWLEPIQNDTRAAVVAEGFQVVFTLMVSAIDIGDLRLLAHYDDQFATTLQPSDVGRFDELGDLLADEQSVVIAGADAPEQERRREVRNALRMLRAVYRLGLVAYALDGTIQNGGSLERLRAAQLIAGHFQEAPILEHVAGKAVEVASDRTVWPFLLQPRELDRVVSISFAPPLIVAFLSILIDLPGETLLAQAWLEQYQPMLRRGLAEAWSLRSEPTPWDGTDLEALDAETIGRQRQELAARLERGVEEVKAERAMRIRRALPQPKLVDHFIDRTREAWRSHRSLGPLFRALGAPSGAGSEESILFVGELPKGALVGEASPVSLDSFAEQAGRQAARGETALIARLLADAPRYESRRDAMSGASGEALSKRVRNEIRRMREEGRVPSSVLTSTSYPVWSRLAIDNRRVDDDRRALRELGVPEPVTRLVRARIDGVVVISIPALEPGAVIVIDAAKAVSVPESDPTGKELIVALSVRDAVQVEADLLAVQPSLDSFGLSKELDEQLGIVDLQVSAPISYAVIDRAAITTLDVESPGPGSPR